MRRAAIIVYSLNAILAWGFFSLHFGLSHLFNKPPVVAYYAPLIILGSLATIAAGLSHKGQHYKATLLYYFPCAIAITEMAFYNRAISDCIVEPPRILFLLNIGAFFVCLFCGLEIGILYGVIIAGVFVWAGVAYNAWGDFVLNATFTVVAVGGAWGLLRLCWRLYFMQKEIDISKEKIDTLAADNEVIAGGVNRLLGAWQERNEPRRNHVSAEGDT